MLEERNMEKKVTLVTWESRTKEPKQTKNKQRAGKNFKRIAKKIQRAYVKQLGATEIEKKGEAIRSGVNKYSEGYFKATARTVVFNCEKKNFEIAYTLIKVLKEFGMVDYISMCGSDICVSVHLWNIEFPVEKQEYDRTKRNFKLILNKKHSETDSKIIFDIIEEKLRNSGTINVKRLGKGNSFVDDKKEIQEWSFQTKTTNAVILGRMLRQIKETKTLDSLTILCSKAYDRSEEKEFLLEVEI